MSTSHSAQSHTVIAIFITTKDRMSTPASFAHHRCSLGLAPKMLPLIKQHATKLVCCWRRYAGSFMVLHHKDECQTRVQDRNSMTDFLSKRFGRCDLSLSEPAQCTTHPPEVSSKTQRNSCLDCLIYDKVCSEVLALCSCFASRLVQNVFTFDEVGPQIIEPPELLGVLSDI